jgi:predicted Ser/Thr protein kinase
VAEGKPLESGDRIGDYRIVRVLSRGGMGVVYLARDERLGRQAALKVIAPHLAHEPEFQHRFEVEARSAAAIEHPNVVPIYAAGSDNGSVFLAMRFIDGTDLRTLLRRSGRLDADVALRIVAEVAAALDAAHAAGLVHRDVKPANILIEGEPGAGRAYLTDFGLTKASQGPHTQLTSTGQWIGTLDYVAPEQMVSGLVNARTDVYALACVLYEMLSGSVPFEGNEMQKMWSQANEPIPTMGGSFSALDSVIAKATAKDPAHRFASAGDLARAAQGGVAIGPEHSVARGAAAVGMAEKINSAPTRKMPGVAMPPVVEPTMPRPISQAERQRAAKRRAGGSLGRAVAIVGAALVIAGGMIVGALVVAQGKGHGAGNTVVARAVTTTARAPSPKTTEGHGVTESSREAPEPQEEWTSFDGPRYSVEVPATWTQTEEEQRASDGSYTENVWISPDGTEGILIDESPGNPADPAVSAANIAHDIRSAGETVYSVHDELMIGGIEGSELDLRTNSERPERADFFFNLGENGFAVLGSANSLSAAHDLIEPVVSSLSVLGDWPGGTGYMAQLGSFAIKSDAEQMQRDAGERGFGTGLLFSSNFSSLLPGYWIVFSGDFPSRSEAADRAARARALGLSPDAFPRWVVPR